MYSSKLATPEFFVEFGCKMHDMNILFYYALQGHVMLGSNVTCNACMLHNPVHILVSAVLAVEVKAHPASV